MVNLTYNKNRPLPSAEELPSSDETPVDNQLQNDIPNLLLSLLALIWTSRDDWYFGVDMAVYYNPEESAFVPDGFLALGVNHDTGERGRLSYVLWQEKYILPILFLEEIRNGRLTPEEGMEVARRSLEDKIAQLNLAIDDVRQQLGSVQENGSDH